jgi:hypothetical protein
VQRGTVFLDEIAMPKSDVIPRLEHGLSIEKLCRFCRNHPPKTYALYAVCVSSVERVYPSQTLYGIMCISQLSPPFIVGHEHAKPCSLISNKHVCPARCSPAKYARCPDSLFRWALLPCELAELVLHLVAEVVEGGGAGSSWIVSSYQHQTGVQRERIRPWPFLASMSGILLILRYAFWTVRLKVGLRMSCAALSASWSSPQRRGGRVAYFGNGPGLHARVSCALSRRAGEYRLRSGRTTAGPWLLSHQRVRCAGAGRRRSRRHGDAAQDGRGRGSRRTDGARPATCGRRPRGRPLRTVIVGAALALVLRAKSP